MPRLALVAALCLAAPAAAAVFSRDLFEPGDGLLTYDDVNQREWLDFSVAAGTGRDALAALISPEGQLAGFELATKDEVFELFEANNRSYFPYEANDWASLLGNETSQVIDLGNEVTLVVTRLSGLTGLDPTGDDEAYSVSFAMQIQAPASLIDALPRRYHIDYYPYRCVDAGGECLQFYPDPFAECNPERVADDVNCFGTLLDLGSPPKLSTFWLYRDAIPTPEPNTAALALAACLGALRLRALA